MSELGEALLAALDECRPRRRRACSICGRTRDGGAFTSLQWRIGEALGNRARENELVHIAMFPSWTGARLGRRPTLCKACARQALLLAVKTLEEK